MTAPTAYLLCGPSLAGKSTLCARLAEITGAAILSADALQAEAGLPFGADGLPDAAWADTLQALLTQLRQAGAAHRSVIVDDTLCFRWLRDRLRAEAQAAGLLPQFLLLMPDRTRLLQRHGDLIQSGERPVLSREAFLAHLEGFERPGADEAHVELTDPVRREAWLKAQHPERRHAP